MPEISLIATTDWLLTSYCRSELIRMVLAGQPKSPRNRAQVYRVLAEEANLSACLDGEFVRRCLIRAAHLLTEMAEGTISRETAASSLIWFASLPAPEDKGWEVTPQFHHRNYRGTDLYVREIRDRRWMWSSYRGNRLCMSTPIRGTAPGQAYTRAEARVDVLIDDLRCRP